ncbi:hypothetical protein J6590_020686 [Homalodisca vitripennis]|nr:hypothetical protein J6590_020686 [Homalodisca vitripennis]
MAGDPEQLGPVLSSQLAIDFGLEGCPVLGPVLFPHDKDDMTHLYKEPPESAVGGDQ